MHVLTRPFLKKTFIALSLSAATIVAPLAFTGEFSASHAKPKDVESASSDGNIYEQLDMFVRVLERVRNQYVDEVSDEEVIEAAIQGMLKSLDPHSTYLNKKIYEDVKMQMKGEYGGLGIEIQMENGVIKIVSPIDNTPAYHAGLQGGDLITHIDGEAVRGRTLTEAVNQMRGDVGSPVTVTIIREGLAESFDVEIVRDKIMVKSVRHRVEAETLGYIRVTTFNMQSGRGVEKAIDELKAELGDNLDGIILDLRSNPGGLLTEAIRISDAFLDKGEIVSTRGRQRNNNGRWFANPGDMIDGLPVVVLVNAYSASASEIVAGALKDHRRAVILGDKTFGKGTVQSEIRLGDGAQAIRLTTARYYTPAGTSIQGRGIEPDIELLLPRNPRVKIRRESDLVNSIENEQQEQAKTGEDLNAPSENTLKKEPEAMLSPQEQDKIVKEKQDDKEKAFEDIQLKRAIELLKEMAHAKPPQDVVAQAK